MSNQLENLEDEVYDLTQQLAAAETEIDRLEDENDRLHALFHDIVRITEEA